MEKIKLITDSTSDIPLPVAEELGIDILSIMLSVNGSSYQEQRDLSTDEFYDLLVQSDEIPTTSQITAFTYEEKFNIAKKHLVPKQITANGLKKSYVKLTDKALKAIISGYTKEAGVRILERTIAKVLRKIAVEYAKGFDGKITVKDTELETYLGPVKYKLDESSKFDQIGVVNGLVASFNKYITKMKNFPPY